MPEFANPFAGLVPGRKMTHRELLRALRLDIAAEEEATHLYEAQADAADNELARRVLQDIADEERVHAGEFQRLINLLASDEEKLLQKGAGEVDEMAEELKGSSASPSEEQEPAKRVPSIGDLKK